MNTSVISKTDQDKISELFTSMDDSPGEDSYNLAMDWLKVHNNIFSGFIDNKFLRDPKEYALQIQNFPEEVTVSFELKTTLNNACLSLEKGRHFWNNLQCFERSCYLYRIAETIEKNSELFAQVEALSCIKHLYRTKTKDVPNLIQSFNYYASLAENPQYFKGGSANGIVCVVAEEVNNSLPSLSWRVASILAAGNVVLLLVDAASCVSAFLFAELCSLSGLPAGVLNVLPINQSPFAPFMSSKCHLLGIVKIIFTGEHLRSHKFIKLAIDAGATCEVLLTQKRVAIVYDSADLHSAANGVLEMLYFNDIRSTKSGCFVYVQASIKEKFYSLLEEKLHKIRVNQNFTKTDMPCILLQREKLKLYLDEVRQQQFKIVQGPQIKDGTNSEWGPALIYDVPTTSKLLKKDVPGPIIITTPFRTVKESIAMFNHDKMGSDVSVWTEKLPLALEVVQKLRTRTIWINTQNMFDASISYGGLGLSGNSIEGGVEALFVHRNQLENSSANSEESVDSYGKETPVGITLKNFPKIKFNYDIHIGGSYKKPNGGMYTILKNKEQTPYAYIGLGTSADIQAAVSSAVAVQPKWQNLGKFKRVKILRKAADALSSKKNEFISLLSDVAEINLKEVDESISRLRYWSNNMKYSDGQVIETESCCKVFQEHNPLGVIGIQNSDEKPLLYFVSTAIPAIACGNAVVAVLNSEISSIPVLKICEILQSSGVLGGTVNVITGCQKNLTRHLAFNTSIDSIWFSKTDAASFLHKSCMTHLKRLFHYKYSGSTDNENAPLLAECTFVKSAYMPQGDIFAN